MLLWTHRMQFWQPCRNFFWFRFEEKLSFLKKNQLFFQNRLRWQFCYRLCIKLFYFLKLFSSPSLWIFLQKVRKVLNLEKLQNLTKKSYFLKKKTLSSFWKASLTKLVGANYTGASRPSCFILHLTIPHQSLINMMTKPTNQTEFLFFFSDPRNLLREGFDNGVPWLRSLLQREFYSFFQWQPGRVQEELSKLWLSSGQQVGPEFEQPEFPYLQRQNRPVSPAIKPPFGSLNPHPHHGKRTIGSENELLPVLCSCGSSSS